VSPGNYSIDVVYGGAQQHLNAVVRPDPRLNVPASQIRTYTRYALAWQGEVTALDTMLNQIVAARKSIARLVSARGNDRGVRQARKVDAQLQSIEEQVFNPEIQHNVGEDMLHALFRTHGKLTRLASVASFGYYQPPDSSMLQAHQIVRRELDAALLEYNHLVATEMPALESTLKSAGIAPAAVSQIKIAAQTPN
jgi:hypothetical protein